MSWVSVGDELPPYGQWVFVLQANSSIPLAAYRHHTDGRGEHWWSHYDVRNDSNEVHLVAYWCAPPDVAPAGKGEG